MIICFDAVLLELCIEYWIIVERWPWRQVFAKSGENLFVSVLTSGSVRIVLPSALVDHAFLAHRWTTHFFNQQQLIKHIYNEIQGSSRQNLERQWLANRRWRTPSISGSICHTCTIFAQHLMLEIRHQYSKEVHRYPTRLLKALSQGWSGRSSSLCHTRVCYWKYRRCGSGARAGCNCWHHISKRWCHCSFHRV